MPDMKAPDATAPRTTKPTRREVLALGLGLAGGVAAGGLPRARAQAVPHTFKLGSADITVISDGGMSLPLSYVLPKAEPKAVSALLDPRGLGGDAYAAQVNITVVRTGNALIVIDSGGGTDFVPTVGQFAERLEQAGIRAAEVTHVLFTHAHPDHFWGSIDALDDDSRFTNARHIMTAAERDHWLTPGIADRMPEALQGLTLGTARRIKAIAKRLDVAKPGAEVLAGVTLVDTAGHTPGHASVMLSFDGQSLLVGGDALSHPAVSFERPDWVWGPDLDPQQAIATRNRLLDQLATDRIPLLGYHLPWPGVGRVERKDSAYRFSQG
jgi:glyoxylase-like metal-dependent hydrolase (beta-lactamase superfamily II)